MRRLSACVVAYAATLPLAAQCGWGLCGQVTPPVQHTPTSLLHFARALSIDCDRVLAGAPGYSPEYPAAGLASISHWNGSNWVVDTTLTPNAPAPNDGFGRAVALRGELAVVGAPTAGNGGRITIFREVPGQGWVIDFEWAGPQGAAAGHCVAIAGNANEYVLVGSPGAALVQVFARTGSVWSLAAELDSPAAQTPLVQASFGISLCADGTRALVGEPNEARAFVFELLGGSWQYQQQLKASSDIGEEGFGSAVALSGNRALVGAPGVANEAGAVFAFVKSGGAWSFDKAIAPPAQYTASEFGRALALSPDAAIVGAPRAGGGFGASFVLDPNAGGWPIVATLAPQPSYAKGQFGSAVAAGGAWVMSSIGLDEIGLYGYTPGQATYIGGAWVASSSAASCEPFLLGYPVQLSAALGGEHMLQFSAGASGPGSTYLVLGSLSGTSPGVQLDGAHLALNQDAYFGWMLAQPNQGPFIDTLGTFAPDGTAHASIALPAGDSQLAGLVAHHAVVVLAADGTVHASAPSALDIVP